MDYRFLGNTGLQVSELCLGSMTFGWTTSKEDSFRALDRFVETGGNFIDSADVYAGGASEMIVGEWLRSRSRDDLVIATKVRFSTGEDPNAIGLSRKHIVAAMEASLRRLQTDYIDLYQVHAWDNRTPLAETLRTLDDLVTAGKVRYIGASNYTGWQLQKAIDLSRQLGLEPFVSLQPLYNLLDRSTEWELVPVCQNEGLGIIPWSPLRGGWLAGKYHRGMEAPVKGSRVEMAEERGWGETFTDYATEHTWHLLDVLYAIADECDREPAQVAIRWLMQRPGVTAPIIAARTLKHLESNLGATGWALTDDQMTRLNAASDRPLPYPYDHINRVLR
ncbi:MAG: aldo/keto reductase [Anaerolineae bacterium]|nr:aldo/keto reductase [Anaerolineae bacterium]